MFTSSGFFRIGYTDVHECSEFVKSTATSSNGGGPYKPGDDLLTKVYVRNSRKVLV